MKCLKSVSEYINKSDAITGSIIANDFYVDELITGFDDLDSAIIYQKKLMSALNSFGFKLSKWYANSELLLKNIPQEDRESLWNSQEGETFAKILGMIWNPNKDTFFVSTKNVNSNRKIT